MDFFEKSHDWVKHGTRLIPFGDGHCSRVKTWPYTESGKLKGKGLFLLVLSNRDTGN